MQLEYEHLTSSVLAACLSWSLPETLRLVHRPEGHAQKLPTPVQASVAYRAVCMCIIAEPKWLVHDSHSTQEETNSRGDEVTTKGQQNKTRSRYICI